MTLRTLRAWWEGLPWPIQYTALTIFIPVTMVIIWATEGNWPRVFSWGLITILWGLQVFYFQYGRIHEAYKRAEQDLKDWQEKVRDDNPQWDITFGTEQVKK